MGDRMRIGRRVLPLLIVMFAGALVQPSVRITPVPYVAETTPLNVATYDEKLREVGKEFPGFGGFTWRDQVLVLFHTEPQAVSPAAIITHLANVLEEPSLTSKNFLVERASYDWITLLNWRYSVREVLSLPGVTRLGIWDRFNQLVVGAVDPRTTEPAIRSIVEARGVPQEAVAVIQWDYPTPLSSLRDHHRPLVGGLHYERYTPGYAHLCTIGFLAVRVATSGYVTNSHCTGTMGVVDAHYAYQPNSLFTYVGKEYVDPAFTTDLPCPPGRRCRYSDSAFYARNTTQSGELGKIAWPAVNTCTPTNSCPWNGSSKFRIVGTGGISGDTSQTLFKVGRTTGSTSGPTDIGFLCDDLAYPGTDITLLCQYLANFNPAPQGGDSGSAVFAVAASGDVTLKGLLWAAPGYFSAIGNVNVELGLTAVCWAVC